MSVRVFSDDSASLLTRIKTLIDEGHITTWEYDRDGDFTHSPNQWRGRAYLRPEVQEDKLRLTIIRTQGEPLTREVFSVYQGRFIEMLSAHVYKRFTSAVASPSPVQGEAALDN
jgi:hypothetical protein